MDHYYNIKITVNVDIDYNLLLMIVSGKLVAKSPVPRV